MIRENSDFLEAYQTDKKNLIAHYDKEISKYYTPARILTIVATHLDGIVEGSMTRFEQEDMSDLLQLYFPDTMSEKLSVDAGKNLKIYLQI